MEQQAAEPSTSRQGDADGGFSFPKLPPPNKVRAARTLRCEEPMPAPGAEPHAIACAAIRAACHAAAADGTVHRGACHYQRRARRPANNIKADTCRLLPAAFI